MSEPVLRKKILVERPLVTLALFTFNQERFIVDAINGALSQTYTPLEIIISDDCSSDNTWEIIQSELAHYAGPHKLIFNRNKTNLGIALHVNRVSKLAQGDLIVGAAGDDISLPLRVEKIFQAYEASKEKVAYIYSNISAIDEDGNKQEFSLYAVQPEYLTAKWMAYSNGGALGASSAWTKNIFTLFGPLPEKIIREDAILPFRAALAGKVLYVNEQLILYRRHGNNIWKSHEDIGNATDLFASLKQHAEGNLEFVNCRINDLEKILNASQGNSIQNKEVRVLLQRAHKEFIFELLLLHTTSKIKRLVILVRAFLSGVGFRKSLKWGSIFFIPALYIKIQQYKNKKLRLLKSDCLTDN